MTLNELTVNFEYLNSRKLLSEWQWLIGKNKAVVLLTVIGDAFVQNTSDGSVHYLDVAIGQLEKVTESGQEFQKLLKSRDFVDKYFSVQVVGDLRQAGIKLNNGSIYSFKVLPILGGEYSTSNIEVTDIEVHFSLTGQIHEQVQGLPDGTPVSSFQFLEKKTRQWWKLWD